MTTQTPAVPTTDPSSSGLSRSTGTDTIMPGRLSNSVQMTVQTRHAQRLMNGRSRQTDKPEIIGLFRFGSQARLIWAGAIHDDPYADWWLLQIEQALGQSRETIHSLRQSIDRELDGGMSMNIRVAESVEPSRVELTFKTPYAYIAAHLLADFDALALRIMTARHVGLLSRNSAHKRLAASARVVRGAFESIRGYRFLSITRTDVRQGNQRGQRAAERLGLLPQAVLDGTLRADYAPDIDQASAAKSAPDADADIDAVLDEAADDPGVRDPESLNGSMADYPGNQSRA